ncbi:MAG: diguanylate cyclase [Planctomycetota bacterium]|nr:diguanylate cyclase [Planctomycetota bacterium]
MTAPAPATTNDLARPPRVLLVEDDLDRRQLMQDVIVGHYGGAGLVVAVETGADCLKQDLAGFDVILLDYNLPDTTGSRLLPEILARADVPVIFVTGENDSATAAQAIRQGAQDYMVKLGDYLFAIPVVIEKTIRQHQLRKDNHRLHQELQAMLSELRVKNIQLEESLGKLEKMAATDPLTDLANRRHFAHLLERSFEEAKRYGFDLTCCMFDLDHYKELNDSLGHQAGDEVLALAADIIRASLRTSDVAARYGGDEFVVLLPHTSIDRGLAVAERTRTELAAGVQARYRTMRPPVTLSIGIASLSDHHPATADELVAFADRALYAAKNGGKDRIVVFGDSPRIKAAARP